MKSQERWQLLVLETRSWQCFIDSILRSRTRNSHTYRMAASLFSNPLPFKRPDCGFKVSSYYAGTSEGEGKYLFSSHATRSHGTRRYAFRSVNKHRVSRPASLEPPLAGANGKLNPRVCRDHPVSGIWGGQAGSVVLLMRCKQSGRRDREQWPGR
jgi:hypothetical protein